MKHTIDDIRAIYELPFTTLIFQAQQVHQKHQDPAGVQLCTLKSIKTGTCPEDCKYCPQSAHYNTFVGPEKLLDTENILKDARQAAEEGASRYCMGAAWKKVPDGPQFESVLKTTSSVRDLGMEVCCTLGAMTKEQAVRLKEAGCTVYNHNLDTSRDYYPKVITSRTYDDRLETLRHVRDVGLGMCCGGIIGMVFCQFFIDPEVVWEDLSLRKNWVPKYGMDGLIPHIEHIADLAGGSFANIAIGTDMDGGFGAEATPTDVDTIADLQGFGPVLKNGGLSDNDVNGILHGNALDFFRRAWSS